MGLRQKAWAREASTRLRVQLGNACAKCGRSDLPLEFDCIRPMGHKHHRFDHSWRLSFYRSQHAAGNLQLLCFDCHQLKTADEQPDRSILGNRCHLCRHTWQDDTLD